MTRGPRSGLVPVVLLPILLVGCGLDSPSERDVCTQYRQFQASTDALRRLNPQTATADQYRAAADKARADLNQVLASADGTLDTSISTVRAAMLDLQEAANTASDKGFAAARPMLADSAANLKQSLAALQSEVQNLCPNTR